MVAFCFMDRPGAARPRWPGRPPPSARWLSSILKSVTLRINTSVKAKRTFGTSLILPETTNGLSSFLMKLMLWQGSGLLPKKAMKRAWSANFYLKWTASTQKDRVRLVFAATNRPWDVDIALRRPPRFGSTVFILILMPVPVRDYSKLN